MRDNDLTQVLEKLNGIEARLAALADGKPSASSPTPAFADKQWFTTEEVAQILDRAPWTVRQWCRLGRVQAKKRQCGRGLSAEWIISRDEIARIRNEGLLPQDR